MDDYGRRFDRVKALASLATVAAEFAIGFPVVVPVAGAVAGIYATTLVAFLFRTSSVITHQIVGAAGATFWLADGIGRAIATNDWAPLPARAFLGLLVFAYHRTAVGRLAYFEAKRGQL